MSDFLTSLANINDAVNSVIDNITLQDLVEKQLAMVSALSNK